MIGSTTRLLARGILMAALGVAGIAAAQPYGLVSRANSLPYLAMPSSDSNVPLLLSQVGAFDAISANTLTPKPGLIPYTVNSAFWSDGAVKTRWIALPYDGTSGPGSPKITFTPGEWTFPDGTVFVKHFEIVVNEMTGAKRRLETRVLVRKAGGYVYGRSYRWREDGTEADAVPDDPVGSPTPDVTENIQITGMGGVIRNQVWLYPKPSQCLACHTGGNPFGTSGNTGGVLGVKTRQQNGNFLYPGTGVTDNQLRSWNHVGMFDVTLSEGSIPGYQRLVAVGDTSATLLNRVRSYLDSNCAQCHRPSDPPAGTHYDARYDTPIPDQRIFGDGLSGFDKLVRFNAGASHIIQRDSLRSVEFGMPPLAKDVVDAFWINTVTQLVNYPFDVTSATVSGDRTKVRVLFSSAVEATSATTLANYTITGLAISGAVLGADGKSVTLSTSLIDANSAYSLEVNNVKELQAPQNLIWPGTLRPLQFTPPLFWRQSAPGTGLSWWTMNGATITGSNYFEVGSEWQIADVGDLSRDGKADIVWRRTTDGAAYLWTLNGLAPVNFYDLGILSPAVWTLVGTGDLNGDGRDDLLWRNADGTLYGWLMNFGTIIGQGVIGNPGTGWTVIDLADMNGDRKADLVLRNTSTGQVSVWFMNGLVVSASGSAGSLDPASWNLLAAADFDGDGKADLLWRSSAGDTWVWLMNGTTFLSGASIGNPGLAWSVKSVTDLDGDGKADLVWRHTDGTTYFWKMNGLVPSAYLPITNPGGTWNIVAP
jgi:FG-GAP-like repeat